MKGLQSKKYLSLLAQRLIFRNISLNMTMNVNIAGNGYEMWFIVCWERASESMLRRSGKKERLNFWRRRISTPKFFLNLQSSSKNLALFLLKRENLTSSQGKLASQGSLFCWKRKLLLISKQKEESKNLKTS